MSRRSSKTNLRMRAAQDAIINCMGRKEDDYDDKNSSTLVVKKWKDLPKRVREAAKAQEGRSVIFAPDSDDNIGWVPEKGTTDDDGFYKKWFRRNHGKD